MEITATVKEIKVLLTTNLAFLVLESDNGSKINLTISREAFRNFEEEINHQNVKTQL